MAQRTAERHAARLKAIQEAQEAQLREDEAARAAAAAASSSASASVPAAPAAARQAATATADSQDDEYHFPSDDDVLYATVDLDGLDDGVGRPIDFEEGAGAATEDTGMSTSAGAAATVDVSLRDAAPSRPNWLQENGSSGNGLRAPAAQQSAATNAAQASASTSTSTGARPQMSHADAHQSAAHPRPGNSSTLSSNDERARTPSMGGGFSFPAPQPNRGQVPPRTNSSSTGASTSGNLKRTADIMQGLQSARRAQQGMGLQNPPNGSGAPGQQLGNGAMREPFSPLEVGEGGDVKRVRRS
ncbi:hypothetical protein LXA43DRAFT_971277 [Ganoderma leucocontextum]|nr:hypothetical protein LXA43DRAFT_971277 [Ganoderma leucocontextum]